MKPIIPFSGMKSPRSTLDTGSASSIFRSAPYHLRTSRDRTVGRRAAVVE